MTRIVAGLARGRRLAVPPGRDTRPTADRAREGLFSALTSSVGRPGGDQPLAGLRFLDLYAGSGAVGLEALSRGAVAVTLVEEDRSALAAVRSNVEALGLPGAEVVAGDVARHVSRPPAAGAYDVVFLDPPYALAADDLRAVLGDLVEGGWLSPGAVVVVERATRDEAWWWPDGIAADRHRAYGEGTLWYGRAAGGRAAGAEPH